MMCHKIGRLPINNIGLGRNSVSSRRREPFPPQRMTTFIAYHRFVPEPTAGVGEPFPAILPCSLRESCHSHSRKSSQPLPCMPVLRPYPSRRTLRHDVVPD